MAARRAGLVRYWVVICRVGGDLHAVPVRPSPKMRTFIGTVRTHFVRLMSLSCVKMSVKGFDLYFKECVIVT